MNHTNKNIDSIRSKQKTTTRVYTAKKVVSRKSSTHPQPHRKKSYSRKTFNYFSVIIASVLVTAFVSIAGQGMAYPANAVVDNLSNNWNSYEIIIAQDEIPQELVVTDSPVTLSQTPPSTEEQKEADETLAVRTEFLKKYLEKRKSPVAEHAGEIAKLSQWKLIVGIMRAESQWCKRHVVSTKNCFGVGGAWNLKHYESYGQGFADLNRLLETKYIAYGLNTPEKMVRKYVGHESPNWVSSVRSELNYLEKVN